MTMLAFPPGLLRSPPIDPKTGLWSRPWLEYWQAQYDRVGRENAPSNTDLDALLTTLQLTLQVDSPSYPASLAALGAVQQLVEGLQREVASLLALRAQLGTVAAQVEMLRREVAGIGSGQAQQGRQDAQLEQLARQEARDGSMAGRVAGLAQRIEAIERMIALVA